MHAGRVKSATNVIGQSIAQYNILYIYIYIYIYIALCVG